MFANVSKSKVAIAHGDNSTNKTGEVADKPATLITGPKSPKSCYMSTNLEIITAFDEKTSILSGVGTFLQSPTVLID
jgi:hypothetical protein